MEVRSELDKLRCVSGGGRMHGEETKHIIAGLHVRRFCFCLFFTTPEKLRGETGKEIAMLNLCIFFKINEHDTQQEKLAAAHEDNVPA